MRKFKIIALTLVVAAIALPAFSQSVEEGRRLSRNEQYEDAEKLFNDIIAAKPKNGEAYYFAGLNYLDRGDTAAAEAIFQKGLINCPKYLMNNVGLGHMKLRNGDVAGATELFNLALKSKKKLRPLINKEIGRAYLMVPYGTRQRMVDYATAAIEKLNIADEAFNPVGETVKDPETKMLLGDAYFVLTPNIANKAIELYLTAGSGLDGKVNDPRPLLREAKVLQRITNYDIALVRINEALSIDPDLAPAYRQKAELFSAWKRPDGYRDSVVKYYREYLKRNNNLSARRMFVQSLYLSASYDMAIAEGKELLKMKEYPNIYGIIAYAIMEKNDTSMAMNREGLEYFDKYEEKHVKPQNRPLSASENYHKGVLLFRVGESDAAFSFIKKALTDTAYAQSYWYDQTVDMFNKSGKYSEVIQTLELKKTKTGDINNRDLYYKGIAYMQLERNMEAIGAFKELVTRDTNYFRGYYLIAANWAKIDKYDSLGNITKSYLEWMSHMDSTDKKKYRRDIENAWRSMAFLQYAKGQKMNSDPADVARGYVQTIAHFNKCIEYYNQVLITAPDDTEVVNLVNGVKKYIVSLQKKAAKKK